MPPPPPDSAPGRAALPASPAPSFSALLGQRMFVQHWWARLGSQMAGQMLMVALGWQLYDLTGSAWDLGLVGLAQFLPALLLTLPAGHLADRVDRARILTVTIVLLGLAALALMLATANGWVSRTWVLSLSVVLGTLRAFEKPATQAVVPQLVPATLLPRALAASSTSTQMAAVLGPALGGLVYAAGPQAVYGASACVLLGAGVAASRIRLPRRTGQAPGWSSVLAGVAFISQRPVLLGAISLDLFAVLLGGATALLPLFAKDILHTGPWGLGLLRAAPAVGAVAVSVWLVRHPPQRRVGRLMLGAVALFGLCMLVFGLSRWFWLCGLALLVSGGADMVSVVVRQSMVQLETPDDMRGRVAAVNSVFIGASNQLGEFESGLTAAWLGPVGSVVAGGLGTLLVCALWIRLFPALWRRDRLAQ